MNKSTLLWIWLLCVVISILHIPTTRPLHSHILLYKWHAHVCTH